MIPLRKPDEEWLLACSAVAKPALTLYPAKRVPIAQGISENFRIARPGGATGNYDLAETPYMVEPINLLGSRFYESICFVGPSQCGKTAALGEGWMTHAVVNDPGDMLIVQMNQQKAREYAKTRINRAIENSPNVHALLSTKASDDNTHDKRFKHGMWLRVAWPTVGNLSSSSYRYVFVTDYDRMDDDVDGEGDVFSLATARTRTFLSRGMSCVESSPGREIRDPHWRPETRHEAPPVSGILGIYNRSDRRRWYWKCPHCAEWFEAAPGLSLFGVPSNDQLVEQIRSVDIEELVYKYGNVICPVNGCIIDPSYKPRMNKAGVWLQDGLSISEDNVLSGTPRTSRIAGYWLGGVAAAYQSWAQMLRQHFQAVLDFALTGNEETLKTAVNTSQSMPYMNDMLRRAAQQLTQPEERAEELERYVVPETARFLVAAVDVQGGANARFIVQVHAVGRNFEQWVVDRYEITNSRRQGIGAEFAPIDPAAYAEDWDLLTERVVRCTYRTPIEDRELRVRMTVVDTGGEDGVTDRSYAWYRRLRIDNLSKRVMLIKGEGGKAPAMRETMQGGRSRGEGDIPVYLLNVNVLKDAVSNGLKRQTPGPGFFHFPTWLRPAFFDELKAEVRNGDGTWTQVKKRNEALDLCTYVRAGCLLLQVDKIRDWDNTPGWCKPLHENSELITRDERREMKANIALPAPTMMVRRNAMGRRVSRSSYLDR